MEGGAQGIAGEPADLLVGGDGGAGQHFLAPIAVHGRRLDQPPHDPEAAHQRLEVLAAGVAEEVGVELRLGGRVGGGEGQPAAALRLQQ